MKKTLLTALTVGALATGSAVLPASTAMAQGETSPKLPTMVLSHGRGFDNTLQIGPNGEWRYRALGPADNPYTVDEGKLSWSQRAALARYANAALKQEAADSSHPEPAQCKAIYALYIEASDSSDAR